MYFYKLLIFVVLLGINIFATGELEVDGGLERHFSVGGSMEGFKPENKDTIRRLYGSLAPEVKPPLLRAFDHGGHMEGCRENVTVSVYENVAKIQKAVIVHAFEMFDLEGCRHPDPGLIDIKSNIISCFVNSTGEEPICFLKILHMAVKEGVAQTEIRKCVHSMRKFKKYKIIQYFCNLWGSWQKYKETYPSSSLNQFFNVEQYVFTVTSLLDEGEVRMAPFNVMEIMYFVFSRKPEASIDASYANKEFLKWFCLNNQTKKQVVSRLNFKGAFKKPFKPEHRAIIREYLGLSKAPPRNRVSKVQLMEVSSADDDKADKLEYVVRERDAAWKDFVAVQGPKMAAERAAEKESKLRELTVVSEPEARLESAFASTFTSIITSGSASASASASVSGSASASSQSICSDYGDIEPLSFMEPGKEGDEPDFPSTEKESNGVTEGYASDSSQSIGHADEDFDPFARSKTPVFGQSRNGLGMDVVPA